MHWQKSNHFNIHTRLSLVEVVVGWVERSGTQQICWVTLSPKGTRYLERFTQPEQLIV
jgi:hypothetical protein